MMSKQTEDDRERYVKYLEGSCGSNGGGGGRVLKVTEFIWRGR
jgi:hypothetical protein